ncbi:cyclic-phosphate processing receiver domain-containing protein [Metabacillus herbersteinensis]|uniref:Cyclic-phosphate processing receiver domain-containing protein n=1 Tax=Metabacillus herbersteinensis TaxID=283816 RepID=A0ABV6GL55_9BACI
MKINVFLDDNRTCPNDHILVENIDECINLLETFHIEHLSLDHDLVNKTRNGLMLVHHMVSNKLFAERITIHSANSGAGRAMYKYFKQAQVDLLMPGTIKVLLRPLPI